MIFSILSIVTVLCHCLIMSSLLIIPFSTLALLYPLPSHPLLFFSPPKDLSPDALTNWFGLFYILFFVADTFTSVPYYALGVELTDSYMERNSVYFWQNLFAGVGTLFGMVTPGALLSRFSLVIRLGCLSGRSPDLQVITCVRLPIQMTVTICTNALCLQLRGQCWN